LLVGAGGGLNRILIETGVTKEIIALSAEFQLSPLLLGWLLAVLMRWPPARPPWP
jgi:GntP family gluconate:H+ symporter